jgi:hypothetical protein
MHKTTINLIKKDYEEINIEFYCMERKTILINKFSKFPLNPNNPKNRGCEFILYSSSSRHPFHLSNLYQA